jgi:hypothetical protein
MVLRDRYDRRRDPGRLGPPDVTDSTYLVTFDVTKDLRA